MQCKCSEMSSTMPARKGERWFGLEGSFDLVIARIPLEFLLLFATCLNSSRQHNDHIQGNLASCRALPSFWLEHRRCNCWHFTKSGRGWEIKMASLYASIYELECTENEQCDVSPMASNGLLFLRNNKSATTIARAAVQYRKLSKITAASNWRGSPSDNIAMFRYRASFFRSNRPY